MRQPWNATRDLLEENHLTPADLGTKKTTQLMIDGNQKVKFLVLGRLYQEPTRTGMMKMEITLVNAEKRTDIKTFRTTFTLSASELGDLGHSGTIKPGTKPHVPNEYYNVPGQGLVTPDAIVALGQMIQQSTDAANPMQNKDLPYKIEIHVRKAGSQDELKIREGKVVGNEYYLPLAKGEEYQIWIYNKTGKEQFVRVLVDGMSTISQYTGAISKGLEVVPSSKSELAPIVNLENARAWVVEPNKIAQVAGFYDVNTQLPKDSGLNRFELGDADESLGARKSYTEKLGRITIGIYPPVLPASKRRASVATKIQAREKVELEIYKGEHIPAAEPTVIYNLRYVSWEEYDKL